MDLANVALQGSFLLRPGSDFPAPPQDGFKVVGDPESWRIERKRRGGDDRFAVEVPVDKLDQGDWGPFKVLKRKLRNKPRRWEVMLAKEPGHRHEDRIWNLLDLLGSDLISANHVHYDSGKLFYRFNPKIAAEASGPAREIDVIAVVGNRSFFVQAKDEADYSNAAKHLEELAKLKRSIEAANEAISSSNYWYPVLWYSSTEFPSEELQALANRFGVFLLTGAHLDYYESMKGETKIARYSFIRDLFKGEEWSPFKLEYPAIRVAITNTKEYFVAVGTPVELMQVCRVDRRSPIKEQSYQRLVRVDKIQSARKYLQKFHEHIGSRGTFGNAIVVVSEGPVEFEPASGDETSVGSIKIAARYGLFAVTLTWTATGRPTVSCHSFSFPTRARILLGRCSFPSTTTNRKCPPSSCGISSLTSDPILTPIGKARSIADSLLRG
jgi:hypothetical protein